MKTGAAVAWQANAPLNIETVDLQGPQAGGVLVEVTATGICPPTGTRPSFAWPSAAARA